ncbi:MAG: hypothetical protein HC915_06015 [Anaerolineae bacterium]|nr:hypothetical protein [Anaerolineae bacterium]
MDWTLIGGDSPRPCDDIILQSWWRSDAVPLHNYSTTLMVIQGNENFAQKDDAIGETLMLLWEAGQFYYDERILTLPCDLPPGDYQLMLQMYWVNENGFQYPPVFGPEGQPLDNRPVITGFQVVAP